MKYVSEEVIADVLLMLGIIIIVAKLFEELIGRLGQAPILGDILTGLVLGPSFLGLITQRFIDEIEVLKWIGIASLLFLAGLETRFSLFMKSLKSSLSIALSGIIVSFILGYFGGLAMGFSNTQSIFLGAILTATSVGITVRTLSDIGALGTDTATVILGAAVLDDVGGLLVLGLCTAIVTAGSTRIVELLITTLIAIVFYITIVFSLHRTSTIIWSRLTKLAHLEDTSIAVLLALTLIIAWASVKVNLSLVVGAYAVGLAFSEIRGVERVVKRFSLIPNIFASLFFVLSVATIDIKQYVTSMGYVTVMVIIVLLAILGKVIGCGLAARLLKFKWAESIFVGIGMMPRAEVALIIASIGMAYGVVSKEVFAGVVLLIYVTSILAPILLELLWKRYLKKQ